MLPDEPIPENENPESQMARLAGHKHRAYDGFARGITDEETSHLVIAGYGAHEAWLQDELERQRKDLALTERSALDADAIR